MLFAEKNLLLALIFCRIWPVTQFLWFPIICQVSENKNCSFCCHTKCIGLCSCLGYFRSFRTIGDQIFMQAFEDTSLPFEEWTHETHIRMAWNYISQYGQDMATPLIKQGIMKFNERNKDKIRHGYSETVTMFYIHVLTKAILCMPTDHTFEDFLLCHQELLGRDYLLRHYSPALLSNRESKLRFFEPDRLGLP